MIYDIAVAGGGASGLMASIAASGGSYKIALLEKNDRVGKKLLATGNGRCNFTNTNTTVKNYHGCDPSFVEPTLSSFGYDETIKFFKKLGILAKVEREGRVYPYGDQASSVLDVLRGEAMKLGVETITGFDIKSIVKKENIFLINGTLAAKCVVVAAGGCASQGFGSDGSGFKLLEGFGHKITPLYPALVQLKTDDGIARALQGVKFDGIASLWVNGKKEAEEQGEILFTSYGVSGPPILQLSGKAAKKGDIWLTLDLMPEYTVEDVHSMLIERKNDLSHLRMEEFFTGMINKKLGQAISKKAGIDKLSMPVSGLSEELISGLAEKIKRLEIKIIGNNGWNNAQVTAGGAITQYFDPLTMESKLVKNLYAVGEVLDIYGDCGGYNLQWAWSSGFAAGMSCLKRIVNGC